MVEVHEGVRRPESAFQLFARDDFARSLEQHGKYLIRLLLDFDLNAVAPELPRAGIHLKDTESNHLSQVPVRDAGHLGSPVPTPRRFSYKYVIRRISFLLSAANFSRYRVIGR